MSPKGFLVVISAILVSASFSSLADELPSFNAEELSQLRHTSQSLLLARGQHRQMMLEEHGPALEKIKEVKNLLRKAQREASLSEVVRERLRDRGPDYEIVTTDGADGVWHFLSGLRAFLPDFSGGDSGGNAGDGKESRKELASLNQALSALQALKDMAGTNSVSPLKFWERGDPEVGNRLDRLESLERRMSGLVKKKTVSAKEVGELYEEVFGSGAGDQPKPDPTIYTITKHVR